MEIRAIFFDLGGVCLTNGWDREQRQLVAQQLGFDHQAFERRHQYVVDALERGALSLDDYLRWTLFYEPRPFEPQTVVEAIFSLSQAVPGTLEIVGRLAEQGYFLATLNNESRELNEHRIRRFGLRTYFSAFFSSCYLGSLKPEPEHYLKALRISQKEPQESLFIDDRPANVEVAQILGMRALLYQGAEKLKADLLQLGLNL